MLVVNRICAPECRRSLPGGKVSWQRFDLRAAQPSECGLGPFDIR